MADHALRLLERKGELLPEHFARYGQHAEMVRRAGTLEKLNLAAIGTHPSTKRMGVQAVKVGRVRTKEPWRVLVYSWTKRNPHRLKRASCYLDGSGVVRYTRPGPSSVWGIPGYLEHGYDIEAEEIVLEVENAREQRELIRSALARRLQGPRMLLKHGGVWAYQHVATEKQMLKRSEWVDGWDIGDLEDDDDGYDPIVFRPWFDYDLPADYSLPKTKYSPGLRVVP